MLAGIPGCSYAIHNISGSMKHLKSDAPEKVADWLRKFQLKTELVTSLEGVQEIILTSEIVSMKVKIGYREAVKWYLSLIR